MAYDANEHLAGVIASTLFSDRLVQDRLAELVWSRFSEEQKRILTEKAFEAASSRIEEVIRTKIYGVGNKGPNLLAEHIESAIEDAFDRGGFDKQLRKLVSDALESERGRMVKSVRKRFEELIGTIGGGWSV